MAMSADLPNRPGNDSDRTVSYIRTSIFGGSLQGTAPALEPIDIALIDARPRVYGAIASMLERRVSGINVKMFSNARDLGKGPLSLAIIWIEHGGEEGLRRLREDVEHIRLRAEDAAILAIIEDEGRDVAWCAALLGLTMISKTTTEDIIFSSIELALAGGTFAASDLLVDLMQGAERNFGSSPAADVEALTRHCGFRQRSSPNVSARRSSPRLYTSDAALTPRELEIVRYLNEGRQNKAIAFALSISGSTVKVHLRNIMKKLHATNRTEVLFLIRSRSALLGRPELRRESTLGHRSTPPNFIARRIVVRREEGLERPATPRT
jgi:DNA-binding NarL/FixJ family response regulator